MDVVRVGKHPQLAAHAAISMRAVQHAGPQGVRFGALTLRDVAGLVRRHNCCAFDQAFNRGSRKRMVFKSAGGVEDLRQLLTQPRALHTLAGHMGASAATALPQGTVAFDDAQCELMVSGHTCLVV